MSAVFHRLNIDLGVDVRTISPLLNLDDNEERFQIRAYIALLADRVTKQPALG